MQATVQGPIFANPMNPQNVSRDTLCTYQYVFVSVCVCVCAQAVDYASNNFIIGSSECAWPK